MFSTCKLSTSFFTPIFIVSCVFPFSYTILSATVCACKVGKGGRNVCLLGGRSTFTLSSVNILRHECINMGKVKWLELWWQLYHASLPVREVGRAKDLSAPMYRGADKSLARPGRNQLPRQEILSFIYPIYNHNWRNICTIYIYNKTSNKRNILTIKQNTSGNRSS